MKNISRQPMIRMLPNGSFVNNTNLDYDDMQAILSESRGMPLSETEKIFIDEMHESLSYATDVLEKIIMISGKEIEDKDNDLYKYAVDAIEYANGIVCVSPDTVGRGFLFKRKEA